eukprot:gene884-1716_t
MLIVRSLQRRQKAHKRNITTNLNIPTFNLQTFLSKCTHLKSSIIKKFSEDHKFINRMMMCGFAVCILWITSLQVALSLVDIFIPTPNTMNVINTCSFLFKESIHQRDQFKSCAFLQMKSCSNELKYSQTHEQNRISNAHNHNIDLIAKAKAIHNTCAHNYINTQNAMSTWRSYSVTNEIPYQTTCSTSEIQRTKTLLGDDSLSKSSVYTSTQQYTTSSTKTVSHLSQYAIELQEYNQHYLHNKTARLRESVINMFDSMYIPYEMSLNVSLSGVKGLMDDMLHCIALGDDDSNTSGNIGGGDDVDVDHSRCILLNGNMGLKELFDNIHNTLTTQLSEVKAIIEVYENTYKTLNIDIYNAVSYANEFFDAVTLSMDWMDHALSNVGISNALCGHSRPDWCDYTKDLWDIQTPSLPALPSLLPIPSAQDLWNQVKDATVITNMNMNINSLQTMNVAKDWMVDMKGILTTTELFLPNDYHPPVYLYASNTTMEEKKQKSDSKDFLATIQSILEINKTTIKVLSVSLISNVTVPVSFPPLSSFSFSAQSLSSPDFRWMSWIFPDLSIRNLLLLLDYIYRIVLTFRLIRKHWDRSMVGLPAVDIRSDRVAEAKQHSASQGGVTLVSLSAGEVGLVVVLLSLVVVGVMWIVLALYLPFYSDYISGCVRQQDYTDTYPNTYRDADSVNVNVNVNATTARGTFIGRNVNSVVFNFAQGDGARTVADGMYTHNNDISHICTSQQSESKKTSDTSVQDLRDIQTAQRSLVEDVQQLKSCLDIKALDRIFNSSCSTTTSTKATSSDSPRKCPFDLSTTAGVPYVPIRSLLSIDACANTISDTTWDLSPEVFDCTALPPCHTSCDGPNSDKLEAVGDHCTCSAQWLVHATIAQVSVALLIYALMHVSRYFLCKGVMMTHWPYLIPNVFEYKATCKQTGEFLHTPGQESISYDLLVKNKLSRIIRNFECKGYAYLVASVLVNVPWVVLLLLASVNIVYTPH